MKIEVTQEHIDKGVRSNGCGCPVALALLDVSGDRGLMVGCQTVRLHDEFHPISRRVRQFIKKFDDGEPVQPFSFNLKDISFFSWVTAPLLWRSRLGPLIWLSRPDFYIYTVIFILIFVTHSPGIQVNSERYCPNLSCYANFCPSH